MNIWVHKLTVDGVEKFITNGDFKPMYDANGCKMPSEMRWVPFKVELPEEYKPEVDTDGYVTIENLEGERVALGSVLDISKETGGPILSFKGMKDLPDCVRWLAEAAR